MTAPCKNCPDRHMGCHAECGKYASYKTAKEEENYKRYLANIAPEGAKRSMWKIIRGRRDK